jgi:hypothetical protein
MPVFFPASNELFAVIEPAPALVICQIVAYDRLTAPPTVRVLIPPLASLLCKTFVSDDDPFHVNPFVIVTFENKLIHGTFVGMNVVMVGVPVMANWVRRVDPVLSISNEP